MNYFLWSRLIYAVPAIMFLGTKGTSFLYPESDCFLYAGAWIVMLLLSLFFFVQARKEMPRLLVHFIFLAECYIYYNLALIGGYAGYMVVAVIISSFYAIDSLRNSLFSVGLHLLELYAVFALADDVFNVLPEGVLMVLLAPLFCRAVMSVIDDRDVIVREEFYNNDIYVPVEDTTLIDKFRRKANLFFLKNKQLSKNFEEEKRKNETLQAKVEEAENEAVAAAKRDFTRQQLNEEIAKMYFSLLANIRIDLSKPINENLDHILRMFALYTKAQYTAVIAKEPPVNKGESYSLVLINSYISPLISNLRDEIVIENGVIWDKIIETINEKSPQYINDAKDVDPLKHLIFTPISGEDGVKGVLVQGFGEDYQENIHNFNMALMVAYQLYTAMENESLYKSSKDGSNIDEKTGLYNKKYLVNSLPVIFNSAYNFSINLACVFIAEDKKQNDSGIELTVKAIKKHIRKSDIFFRYSDNSFVVLFSGIDKERIENFANEVNSELANCPTTLSVSMGAKIYEPTIGNVSSGKELLAASVKELSVARQQGTGRIVVEE